MCVLVHRHFCSHLGLRDARVCILFFLLLFCFPLALACARVLTNNGVIVKGVRLRPVGRKGAAKYLKADPIPQQCKPEKTEN